MKLPSKLATSLGAIYASIVAIVYELHASHTIKEIVSVAGVLAASWLIHPQEGAHEPSLSAPPQSAVKPEVPPAV